MTILIRATTTDAELETIQFVDMRAEAKERRDDALAVMAEQGDQVVLEYVEYNDGVAVLYSPAFGYALVNCHSTGVGDSYLIESGLAESAENAADTFRREQEPA
jgi:hypothetical protein